MMIVNIGKKLIVNAAKTRKTVFVAFISCFLGLLDWLLVLWEVPDMQFNVSALIFLFCFIAVFNISK